MLFHDVQCQAMHSNIPIFQCTSAEEISLETRAAWRSYHSSCLWCCQHLWLQSCSKTSWSQDVSGMLKWHDLWDDNRKTRAYKHRSLHVSNCLSRPSFWASSSPADKDAKQCTASAKWSRTKLFSWHSGSSPSRELSGTWSLEELHCLLVYLGLWGWYDCCAVSCNLFWLEPQW